MKYFLIAAIILLQGCTNTIAVRTLESTIRDAALAVQSATQGASDELKIEVRITNGFKAGGTLPIPVVPLNISKTSSTSTKLTLKIDLTKFNPARVKSVQGESDIFILDTRTGLLSTPKP